MSADVVNGSAESPRTAPEVRPFYWSVRREVWEYRAIVFGPLLVAALFMFGFMISLISFPRRMAAAMQVHEARVRHVVESPIGTSAGLLMMAAIFIGFFYCLDALNGERRDRSILFWKSMPVSDRTTVLSKAAVPLLVLPLLVFLVHFAMKVLMVALSTVVLLGDGRSLAAYWKHLRFVDGSVAVFYGLVVLALWHLPIYAWLLLISAWARRAAVLWAVLPFLAVAAVEKALFDTTTMMLFLANRVTGFFRLAFDLPDKGSTVAVDPLAQLTPLRFLAAPGLWLGMIAGVLFLVAATRLRRNREPM
jgi:ABC-2 type transport system permease protein